MQHHAFVIEAEAEEGIVIAQGWVEKELGMKVQGNPDVVVMKYGLLSVDDARRVTELAAGKAFAGNTKVVIIAATRAYHEAQNALLKVFEEPPAGAYLFLILPSLGSLLPTLRSRVQEISLSLTDRSNIRISEIAEEFMKANREKRSAMINRLTSGKDEEERRELREETIQIVNGIEAIAYQHQGNTLRSAQQGDTLRQGVTLVLKDIAILRGHLYDRSAPVKMILEHLSLVIPKGLV